MWGPFPVEGAFISFGEEQPRQGVRASSMSCRISPSERTGPMEEDLEKRIEGIACTGSSGEESQKAEDSERRN